MPYGIYIYHAEMYSPYRPCKIMCLVFGDYMIYGYSKSGYNQQITLIVLL